MIRNTILCTKCQKNISKSNYKRHYESCYDKKYKLTFSEDWIINDNGDCKCPYCSKIYPKMGIITHILRTHTNSESFENCYKSGTKIAWNKGLNKDSDDRIKKGSETFKNKVKNGEIQLYWKDKHHTDESKLKIGQKLIMAVDVNGFLILKKIKLYLIYKEHGKLDLLKF